MLTELVQPISSPAVLNNVSSRPTEDFLLERTAKILDKRGKLPEVRLKELDDQNL